MKARIRALDDRLLHGRFRRWWLKNAVLGGGWGEFMASIEAAPPGARVLDLGAGEAELRARLPHVNYIAVDRGVGHGGWDYSRLDAVADAQAIPLASDTFDVVICKQVLEHVPDPILLLREAARVLRPGGVILLSTNQQWPQHQQPYDFFRFTSFGLDHCFEQAGLTVEKMESMGGAFSVALFGFSQTLAPHLWAKSAGGQRVAGLLTKPFAWLMRLLMPLVSMLDRRDKTRDNTLGWYVRARKPL